MRPNRPWRRSGWCRTSPPCLYGRGVASPVLKIARLGLPLQIVRNVLDNLRAFGRRDLTEGMSKGLTAYGGQHHGHVMQRYTGLLPALHEGRHLTVQSGYLWRAIVVERRVRGRSHRRASDVI